MYRDTIRELQGGSRVSFKNPQRTGQKGLLECQIEGLILPLLADHVLREANHYIRILECGYEWSEG